MTAPEGFIADPVATPFEVPEAKATPTAAAPVAAGAPAPAAPAPSAGVRLFGVGPTVRPTMVPASRDEITAMRDPTTLAEALFTGAMFIAPLARLVPYVSKLPMALTRIVLGSVGSGTGSALEGRGFMEGAKSGAISGAIGETIGAAAPKVVGGALAAAGGVARNIPGVSQAVDAVVGPSVKQAEVAQKAQMTEAWKVYRQQVDAFSAKVQSDVAASDAARVGQMLGKAVPPLAGRETAAQLDALKAKGTKALVGEYFANRVTEAQNAIGPEQTVRIPALARVPPASKIEAGDPEAIKILMTLDPTRVIGGNVDVAAMQGQAAGRMTLHDAADRMAALRLRAGLIGSDPGMRSGARQQERAILGQAREQIATELASFGESGQKALTAWNDGRRAYAVGSAMIDLFRREGIFKRDAEKVDLNPRVLQTMIAKHRGWLEERMGPADFKSLIEATRLTPATIGQADMPGKKGELPRFVGLPLKGAPTPPQEPPPLDLKYPVDLSRIMIDSAVHRLGR